MLIDINPNMKLPKYTLVLCKRNGKEMCELGSSYNKVYKHNFADIDEFTFNVPYYINQGTKNHEAMKNPNYDLIKGNLLIKLGNYQYFVIDDITIHDCKGKTYKEIHCYSREYELSDKKLRGYKFDSRKIYSTSNELDEDGFSKGIMNYIETLTSWTVEYVSPELYDVYRGFDIANDNLIAVIQDIQKIFECLFQFDTVNKQFKIYKLNELGQNKGLYISDENYIKDITKNIDDNMIKTRLYLYGKNNISVEDINITGQNYIMNLNYFKREPFMEQDLIDALNNYEEFISNKDGVFQDYLTQLDDLNAQLTSKKNEINSLETDLDSLKQNKDLAMASGKNLTTYNQQIEYKEREIDIKENEKQTIQNNIDNVNININTLREEIKMSSHLTSSQIEQLDPFIKDETFSDSSYVVENKNELLEYGIKYLVRISQPPIKFTIDSVNFLNIIECQYDWEKLVVGDIINIKHDRLGIDTEVRLISYVHNIDDNKLDLEFSNRNNINDPYNYEIDLLKQLSTTNSSVNFSKYDWNTATSTKTQLEKYINSKLDLSTKAVITSNGQEPIMDKYGIHLKKKLSDGTISPEQIKLVNNAIVITPNAFNTATVAITPSGVNAQAVNGLLGNFCKINANQILVQGDGTESTVQDKINNAETNAKDYTDNNAVKKDTLYNSIKITPTNGIQVLDSSNRERVKLGNYTSGKYGLLLKDSTGKKTILDEDGILQTWQEGNVDNVDSDHPLKLNVYIPSSTKHINVVNLRFQLEEFRAYSKGAKNGGSSTPTSESSTKTTTESKTINLTSTEDGDIDLSTTEDGGNHRHLMASYVSGNFYENSFTEKKYKIADSMFADVYNEIVLKTEKSHWGSNNIYTYGASGDHYHKIEIPKHHHKINMPSHFHKMDHRHDVKLPAHTHQINYGIYENTKGMLKPTKVKIKINGTDRTSSLGGSSGFTTGQDNLNITPYLNIGKWNKIELESVKNDDNGLGRIDASLFIQALMSV